MHISEGLLPAVHAVLWTAASAPMVALSARSLSREMKSGPERRVEIAAATAFVVTLSALKLPSVTGSCSHPTGVGLGTLLVGPRLMPAVCLAVLLFQCLALAHGGLTTLGANTLSMGVAGPLAAWLTLRWLGEGAGGRFAAGLAGSMVPYAVTSLQLALAHPVEGDVTRAFTRFALVLGATQVPLAISEGVLTVYAGRWFAHLRRTEESHATS